MGWGLSDDKVLPGGANPFILIAIADFGTEGGGCRDSSY